jgi:stage II sporulation protein D
VRLGIALLLVATAAATARAESPELRVLLYEGPGPVRIDGRGGSALVGLRGDGVAEAGGPARPVWRSGPGPHRFAGLALSGRLEVRRGDAGLLLVNALPLESYLVGTLGREMSASWPAAALRAQAVVSRTYALHQRLRAAGAPFDLRGDTRGQVYGGAGAESAPVRAAVEATRGEILTWQGEPILAAFHSASGGRTASAAEVWGGPLPYLVSLRVEGEDASPDTYWRAALSRLTLGRALAGLGHPVGAVRHVEVQERSASGRVERLRVVGSQGAATVTGRALRDAVGEEILRSTLFDVRDEGDQIVFFGSGRGHGVGLSQWGARAMAERGADYREILATFYPGTRIERWEPLAARGGRR